MKKTIFIGICILMIFSFLVSGCRTIEATDPLECEFGEIKGECMAME